MILQCLSESQCSTKAAARTSNLQIQDKSSSTWLFGVSKTNGRNGAVLLRAAKHQCRMLCHLPESDPCHHLSHRHHAPGRELDPYKLVWKDEALGHLDMCSGNDDGQPVQRQPGASSKAYPPAETTVPCSNKLYPSPQSGCGHIVPVQELPWLFILIHHTAQARRGCCVHFGSTSCVFLCAFGHMLI